MTQGTTPDRVIQRNRVLLDADDQSIYRRLLGNYRGLPGVQLSHRYSFEGWIAVQILVLRTAGDLVRGGNGLGFGGATLPQEDRKHHDRADGEELALPVLE